MPLPTRPRHIAAAVVGVCALTAVCFHDVVLGGAIFFERDLSRVYLPARMFWVREVMGGHLPEWYPYDGLGQPFLGAAVTHAFHPSNLLSLLFSPYRGLELSILICFPLCFFGVLGWLRSMGRSRVAASLCALVVTFSGYTVSITNNLPYLLSLAVVPWALWATQGLRRTPTLLSTAWCAALLSLVLLGGDSQAFVVSCGVAAAYTLWPGAAGGRFRDRAAWVGALAVLAGAFGAVQLLCSLQVAREGNPADRTLPQALEWSLHPWRALDVLFGNVWQAPPLLSSWVTKDLLHTGMEGLWANSLYLGVPFVAAAAWGAVRARHQHEVRLAALLTAVLLALAVGRHLPVYGWLFEALPPWRPFRYPEKLVPALTLWVALLAAHGADDVLSQPKRAAKVSAALALGCGGVALLAYVLPVFAPLRAGFTGPPEAFLQLEAVLRGQLFVAALQSMLLCSTLAAALAWAPEPARPAALFATLASSLLWVAQGSYHPMSPQHLLLEPGFLSELAQREPKGLGSYRVYSSTEVPGRLSTPEPDVLSAGYANALVQDLPALWGVEGAGGYLPGSSRRTWRLLADGHLGALLPLLNVKYLSFTWKDVPPGRPGVTAVNSAFELSLVALKAPLPRVYVAAPRCVSSVDEARALLELREVLAGEVALVECAQALMGLPAPPSTGHVELTSYAPHRVELDASLSAPGVVVLADAYYSGWSATVDGVPTPISPTNVAVRSVPVPLGQHHVAFEYHTPGLWLGAVTTASAWLLLLVTALRAWRGRLRAGASAVLSSR